MDYPLEEGSALAMVGDQQSGTCGLTILPIPGVANTMGAWGTITTSAPISARELWLYLGYRDSFDATNNPSIHVDIASGIGGSILASRLYFGDGGGALGVENTTVWRLPLPVDRGDPIYARFAWASTSKRVGAGIILAAGGIASAYGFNKCVTYGAVASDTGGTQVAPSATQFRKGSWVQIAASTQYHTRAIIVTALNSGNVTYGSNTEWLIDIGYGPAGSEQAVISDWHTIVPDSFRTPSPAFGGTLIPIPVNIPAGSRLAVRSAYFANNFNMDVVVYAFS